MNPIFKKLNYKDQKEIHILNAPPTFSGEMDSMRLKTVIKNTLAGARDVDFILAFTTRQRDVDELAAKITGILREDGIIWFAYPKGTSKKYRCEFNRDTGWNELGKQGFEPVRMVAIDEDWSALRFRKADKIKTMTRSSALSEAGKKRITAKKKKAR
jgi:hypothetical protein